MKGFKTLFSPLKFPWARERNHWKFILNFGTRPQKASSGLLSGQMDWSGLGSMDGRYAAFGYWLCWAAGFSQIIYGRRMLQREFYFMKMGKLWTISALGDGYRRFEDTCCLHLRERTAQLSCRIAKQRGSTEIIEHRKHGATSQKTGVFLFAATRSSNLIRWKYKVGTLVVATIYLQLIPNRYMFRSFTVLQCSHQHCVQPVASDVEVVGYL